MLPDILKERAARFRAADLRRKIFNPMIRPRWIGDRDRFWYPHESADGITYTEVDAETGERQPAFDHAALAAAIGPDIDPAHLPIERLRITPGGALSFSMKGRRWTWREGHPCMPGREEPGPGEVVSPDGRWAAYRHANDLWVRDTATGVHRPLTTDGAAHYAYAKSPDMNLTTITLARRGITLPAAVLWSPDSRRLFTARLDERWVRDLPLVQHVPGDGSARPVLHNLRVALSGDAEVPFAEPLVIEVPSGTIVPARLAREIVFTMTSIERNEAWWSADGARVFHLSRDRAQQTLTLWETDAFTGAAREVLTETSETFIDVNLSVTGMPNIRVLDASREVVWFSQRDGRAHLYLYDLATGAMKNRITSRELIVRDLAHVDEAARTVYFLAGGLERGADPARRKLCRVGLDGSGFVVLTPEPGDHELAMPAPRPPRDHIRPATEPGWFLSPSGRYFVDTYGALDHAPVSVLRRHDGSTVTVLAEAAPPEPWCWPIPFTAKAADGETDLYGAIWVPTDFDPSHRYPVIDHIYPGPQRGNLPTIALADTVAELSRSCLPQSFAELGFVVFIVDGRGAPLRDKAFHDLSYGQLQNPGRLEDHVAVLRELGRRYAWFDTGRVGIMGHSGGGYASVRALLEYPDVFHAAVASSGNHDQRGYSFAWCEKYQGLDDGLNYAAAANPPLAERLRGKLLLATGEMDDNVHPALTLQLVDALIRADKDFELIVLPNADHTNVWSNPYFLRRAMDFLRTALGA